MAPTLDFISDIQREQDNAMRALEATRRAKEQEKLRRHNELVSALREAGEKNANIIIEDHAGDIRIRQNSACAKQKMEKTRSAWLYESSWSAYWNKRVFGFLIWKGIW